MRRWFPILLFTLLAAASGASSTVPTLTEIQAIRKIEFKIEANFSALRTEVEKQLQQLSKDFPNWQFSAQYGP